MASTYEQRTAAEDAIVELLDADQNPDELREWLEAIVDSWKIDNA